MLPQELLNRPLLVGLEWAEASIVIEKHHRGALKEQNHVWLVIAVDIQKTQRHRYLVGAFPE